MQKPADNSGFPPLASFPRSWWPGEEQTAWAERQCWAVLLAYSPHPAGWEQDPGQGSPFPCPPVLVGILSPPGKPLPESVLVPFPGSLGPHTPPCVSSLLFLPCCLIPCPFPGESKEGDNVEKAVCSGCSQYPGGCSHSPRCIAQSGRWMSGHQVSFWPSAAC